MNVLSFGQIGLSTPLAADIPAAATQQLLGINRKPGLGALQGGRRLQIPDRNTGSARLAVPVLRVLVVSFAVSRLRAWGVS